MTENEKKKSTRFDVGSRTAARIDEATRYSRAVPHTGREGLPKVQPIALSKGDEVVTEWVGDHWYRTKRVKQVTSFTGAGAAVAGTARIDFEDGSYTVVPPGMSVIIPIHVAPERPDMPAPAKPALADFFTTTTAGYTGITAAKHPPAKKAPAKKAPAAKKKPAKKVTKFEMKGHNMEVSDLARFEFKLTAAEITRMDESYLNLMVEFEQITTEFEAWQSPGHDFYTFRGEAPVGLLEPLMSALANAAKRELKVVARTS